MVSQKQILIVDDNQTNLKILGLMLQNEGYDVRTTYTPEAVIDRLAAEPDIILLDVNMPVKNGFDLCAEIKSIDKYKDIPVIFISALTDADAIVKGFQVGAVDYITKPFKSPEVRVRIATQLKLCALQEQLKESNDALARKVESQVREITQTQMETIFSLAKLAQSRDDDTGKHLERVQAFCSLLAEQLAEDSLYKNEVTTAFIKNISLASPLHDIGKVGVPDSILLKPGKLTPEEFEIIKTHTDIGYRTLKEVSDKFGGKNEFIEMGMVIARSHHERIDGHGYPEGLSGRKIPLAARIMALADVYDALRSKRVYKESFSQEKTCDIIKGGSGTQFDSVIVDAFIKIAERFDNTWQKLQD